jgi:hypothetical protein
MKTLIAGAALAVAFGATVAGTVPASAQRIDIGPGGPSIDLRSRGQRERDFRREEFRRDEYRRTRDYDRPGLYRGESYDGDRPRRSRRDYGY